MIEDPYQLEGIRSTLEKKYKSKVYLVKGASNYPWKVVLSTIPSSEIYTDTFKRLLKGSGMKNFMESLNEVFEQDCVLFYSKKYPLGNKNPLITISDVKILCLNYPRALRLIKIIGKHKFLEFIRREYPNADIEKLGITKAEIDILKEEEVPKKSLVRSVKDSLFPPRETDVFDVDLKSLEEKKRMDFLNNLDKIIYTKNEIERRIKVISKLKKLKSSPDTLEERFHEILIENPWIFGDEYSKAKPTRKKLKNGRIPDITLKDIFDGQDLVLELKRAVKIYKNDSRQKGKIEPNRHILQALWQSIGYLNERVKEEKYSTVYILIGWGDDDVKKMLNEINFHINNIRFKTYDELIDRAEARIKAHSPTGISKFLSFFNFKR